jgi:phosphoribosylanthranilate isomerase
VDPAAAARIVRAAGTAPVVGVFVDASRAEVEAAVARAGFAAVQLCGAEQPADFAGLPFPVWRRVPCDPLAGAAEIARWRAIAGLFVLDHPSAPGGSGRTPAPEVARRLAALAPCLLAGGLDAGNVAALAAVAAPHGVDASSRLESAPGRKDPALVKRFVAAARAALAPEAAHA